MKYRITFALLLLSPVLFSQDLYFESNISTPFSYVSSNDYGKINYMGTLGFICDNRLKVYTRMGYSRKNETKSLLGLGTIDRTISYFTPGYGMRLEIQSIDKKSGLYFGATATYYIRRIIEEGMIEDYYYFEKKYGFDYSVEAGCFYRITPSVQFSFGTELFYLGEMIYKVGM